MLTRFLLSLSTLFQGELVETVRIGTVSGDAAYEFHRVVAIGVTPAGEIVVANGGSVEIRVFGADGRHRRSFGGRGGGPGEFESLAAAFFRDGAVHVPGSTVLRVIGLDGVYRRTEQQRPHGMADRAQVIGVGEGGHVVRASRTGVCGTANVPCARPVRIEWYDAASGSTRPLTSFVEARVAVLTAEPPFLGYVRTEPIFEAGPKVGVDGAGNVYVTSPDRYRVEVLSPAGEVVRTITRPHEPRRIPGEQLNRVRRCMLDVPAAGRSIAERQLALPHRETLPVITEILVAADGAVWLRRGDVGTESADARCQRSAATFTWDRFDAAGQFLGSVRLPNSFRPLHVTAGDWSRLVDYVHRQLHLPVEESEDLVQEALGDIHTGDLDSDEPVKDPLRWAAAILRLRALHVFRYHHRFEELSTDQPVPNASGPFATAEHARLRHDLILAFDQLPADQREAIVLHDVEGWSTADIAELVGSTPAAIRQRLTRGRSRLRQILDRYSPEGSARE